ncbi:lasso RiPP family leader peptide-containing protein [Sphingopyxis sp. BSNA05]|nr:lasso RiPP family leader peptide-containing protein [Sphingopyxis sp. BSNA05]
MKNEMNEQNNTKAVYEKPELEDHGSLAEHTQSGNAAGAAGDLGSS